MTAEDHTQGPVPCDQVGMFVDGELDAAQAEAFRNHLVQCARCQGEMHALLQLAGLAEEASRVDARSGVRSGAASSVPPPVRPWARASRLAAVGGLALAAVVVGVVVVKQRSRTSDRVVPTLLASLDTRSVSGWPSALGVVSYRGYDTVRGLTAPSASSGLASAELRAEQAGDWRTAGTLALLRRDFNRADAFLARLPAGPDVLADRGLLRLEEGNCDEALEFFEQALRKEQDYPPARFNRALCLRRMDLVAAASSNFSTLAAANLGGWSSEAKSQVDDLERTLRRRDELEQTINRSGRASIDRQEPIPADVVSRFPGRARTRFYRMLTGAPGATELRRLIPVASALDRELGTTVLETRTRAALAALRPERARIAQELQGFYLSYPSSDAVDSLLERARRAGQDDQALQLYDDFKETTATPERVRLNQLARDPYSRVLLAAATAHQQRGGGQVLDAEKTLRLAKDACTDESLATACWYLDIQRVAVELALSRFDAASRIALASARKMRALGIRGAERNARLQAGEVLLAAGKVAAAQGSFEDLVLREPDVCQVTVYRAEHVAAAYVRRGDVVGARKALAGLPDCDALEMDPSRLALRLDLAVLEKKPEALLSVIHSAESFIASPGSIPEDRALAIVAAARAAVELDRPGATEDLANALKQLDPFSQSSESQQARARGWASLGLAELRRGNGPAALRAIASQLRIEPPARCAVALIGDTSRHGWSSVDATGVAAQRLESDRAPSVPPPPGCKSVAVLASGWDRVERALPDTVAWTVRLVPSSSSSAPPGDGDRLLVRDVRPPPDLHLPALGLREARTPGDLNLLEGPEATPDLVLRALRRASYAEFEVHGLIDADLPDGAFLVLSEDSNRRYALSARELQGQTLPTRPIVMLGACRAAVGSTVRDEAWTLPRAFLHAGARGVFAARVELPDAEVGLFFSGIRERLERGAEPSVALRDERLAWLGKGRSWVRDVLVFD